MPSRIYDFTTGYDQVSAPDAATPSGVGDLATVGYGVSNYAIYVADVAAVKALGATFRANGKACFVDSLTAWFYFDSASSATGDDVLVITPTAGTGRWIRVNITTLGATQDVATATTIASLSSSTPVVRMTGSTATTIQGIAAGITSQVLLIYNVSSALVTLAHQNGSASAADRLALASATDLGIPAGGSALLRYDAASSRWTPASASGSSSGSSVTSSYDLTNATLACSVGSSALTIALKDSTGADASALSPVSIGFRDATSATGTYTTRTVTAALSLVVSSGSTLAHRSGDPFYIYVYAVDTGSGVVLGVSSAIHDDGTVKSTTAEGGAGAADSPNPIYTTSAQTNKPIRLLARLTSNQTTAGTWAAVPTEISLAPFTRSGTYTGYVRLFTGNGFGSTNTKIRRFATIQVYGGTDITITQSSTLGDSFTLNNPGVYAITYGDEGNTGSPQQGLTLNSANLTTDINACPDAEVLVIGNVGTGNERRALSYTGRFAAGEIS